MHDKTSLNLIEYFVNISYIPIVKRSHTCKPRMHSSRMRTGRSLTVCCSLVSGPGGGGGLVRGGVWPGGMSGPGGCVCSGGVWSRGVVSAPEGGVWSRGVCLPQGVCSGGCLLRGGLVLGGVSSGGVYPSMH